MSNLLKDNRLPIGISVAALVVVTIIGLVPVLQSNDREVATDVADVTVLEERLAALEAGATDLNPATDIPENASNARLRQEIDLLTRGLGNQTGRVSRLKASLEGVVDEGGNPIPSSRVRAELDLASRGLANLTRRINELSDRMDALDTAAADIARLQQQMALADQAFARLAAANNQAKAERATLVSLIEGAASGQPATAPDGTNNLVEIEAKLDAILNALGN